MQLCTEGAHALGLVEAGLEEYVISHRLVKHQFSWHQHCEYTAIFVISGCPSSVGEVLEMH
jgi:hypothetical protein